MAINRMGQMMKVATQSTPTGESLEQVKQRFALLRAGRERGTHISAAFWAAAVGLVAQHGLRCVVREWASITVRGVRSATDIAGSGEEINYLYKNNFLAAFDYKTPQDLVSAGRIGRMIFTAIQVVVYRVHNPKMGLFPDPNIGLDV